MARMPHFFILFSSSTSICGICWPGVEKWELRTVFIGKYPRFCNFRNALLPRQGKEKQSLFLFLLALLPFICNFVC